MSKRSTSELRLTPWIYGYRQLNEKPNAHCDWQSLRNVSRIRQVSNRSFVLASIGDKGENMWTCREFASAQFLEGVNSRLAVSKDACLVFRLDDIWRKVFGNVVTTRSVFLEV